MPGNLTKNFSRREFRCHCGCGFDQIETELVKQIQTFRDLLWIYSGEEVSITPTCGCRCETHNEDVGGTPHSFHLVGMAADITFKKVPVMIAGRIIYLANKLGLIKVGAIGVYPDRNFIHLDIRSGKGLVTWINKGGHYQYGVNLSEI